MAKKNVTDELFLTPREVRSELKISKRELKKLRESEQGPKFVKITRTTILYFRIDVLDWKSGGAGSSSTA